MNPYPGTPMRNTLVVSLASAVMLVALLRSFFWLAVLLAGLVAAILWAASYTPERSDGERVLYVARSRHEIPQNGLWGGYEVTRVCRVGHPSKLRFEVCGRPLKSSGRFRPDSDTYLSDY